MAPYPFELQHVSPDPGHQGFHLAHWRFVGSAKHGLQPWRRQGLAVEFAGGVEGQCVELHEGGRHHVFRQVLQHMVTQGLQARRLAAQGEVGHQALIANQYRHLVQRRVGGQVCFDLSQLQAHTAQLDLEVVTPKEFKSAVWQVAHQVAGAIQAVAGHEGAVDETFGGQLFQAQVTTGNADAADVQLAADTHGHRRIMSVQDIQAGVVDGAANRQLQGGHRRAGFEGPGAAVHRGFGGAVHVMQAHCGQARLHATGQGGGEFAAAAHYIGEAGAQGRFVQVQKLLQHGGHKLDHPDLLLTNHLGQVRRFTVPIGPRQHQAHAVAQRPEQLPHRTIEAERRALQQGAAFGVRAQLRAPMQQVAQATVLDHHTLGRAGGARGVHHVGEIGDAQAWHAWIVDRRLIPSAVVEVDQRDRDIAHPFASGSLYQQCHWLAVCEHVGQALAWVTWVERHIGAARLENSQ
ncbi:hypothetical protein PFLmoz3_00723 [Pseudomonas fluorescens]|uniref:Uncharacterized protein n=1 Tax=Pseudomonas fluorescens TaxID=294 RepID=A0A109LLJ5_PSEFL|nr:hypothetical protein PFLmoz3_00723 [Pseudomonas fluorescens]